MTTPGISTFQDALTRFRNRSIHTYVGHCLMMRGQILQDGEFGVQSGWDTATNELIMEHLVRLDFLRRKITHNPQSLEIQTLMDRAKDLSLSLPDDINEKSPAGDEVARAERTADQRPSDCDQEVEGEELHRASPMTAAT